MAQRPRKPDKPDNDDKNLIPVVLAVGVGAVALLLGKASTPVVPSSTMHVTAAAVTFH